MDDGPDFYPAFSFKSLHLQHVVALPLYRIPNEAEFPEMPNSVRSAIKADYSIRIQKMPGIKKKNGNADGIAR